MIKYVTAYEFISAYSSFVLRAIEWGYKDGFDLLKGELEQSYPITISASVQLKPDIKASVTFNLILKNPCIEPGRT